MRNFLHLMIVLSCVLGSLMLLGATFGSSLSAPQQSAIASLVVAWVAIFHVLSSMMDRRD